PVWLKQAVDYLKDIEAGESWAELLEIWQEFECSMGYPDGKVHSLTRLSAKGRPEELPRWINGGRNYDKLPIPDPLEPYVTRWKGWWQKMQPKSRHDSDAWPLPQTAPGDDNQWEPLRRGGCNGIFIAIIGLAIW
ncbi:hypothetical protein C8T65DRAFT_533374, partial [Cerioporus squamosus]